MIIEANGSLQFSGIDPLQWNITPDPQKDNTEALRQCLLGSAPADHLEPAEQVELIYRGIVAELQGRGDDTAAQISPRRFSPIHSNPFAESARGLEQWQPGTAFGGTGVV